MVSSKSCFIVSHALKRFETHNLRLLIRRSLFDPPIVSTLAPVVVFSEFTDCTAHAALNQSSLGVQSTDGWNLYFWLLYLQFLVQALPLVLSGCWRLGLWLRRFVFKPIDAAHNNNANGDYLNNDDLAASESAGGTAPVCESNLSTSQPALKRYLLSSLPLLNPDLAVAWSYQPSSDSVYDLMALMPFWKLTELSLLFGCNAFLVFFLPQLVFQDNPTFVYYHEFI